MRGLCFFGRMLDLRRIRHRDVAIQSATNFGAHQVNTMNQQSTSSSAPAGHIFSGGGTLYFARLMRPEEVAKATRNHPVHVQENIAGHWMLCSDVSKQMFGLLKQAPKRMFPTRLTAFRSSSGVCYGVLTHQISGHQHRFLTVLSDPSVRLFLQSMTKERLGFMLGNDNSEEALVLECPL